MLSLAFTFALSSRWPVIDPTIVTIGTFVVWIVSEATFGIAAGVLLGLIAEAIVMGAQILGLQAGYGYASTIDPNTQADSGILLVMAQFFAGMLFFALGLDRQLVMIFANSLEAHPPGSWLATSAGGRGADSNWIIRVLDWPAIGSACGRNAVARRSGTSVGWTNQRPSPDDLCCVSIEDGAGACSSWPGP